MCLKVNLGSIIIVENKGRCIALSFLATIWIECHFPLKDPIVDFLRSLFKSIVDVFMSCTIENREVTSANHLASGDKPSGKLLI